MNRIQSIFKETHKILFSAVALLLILCMLPTQVFAAKDGGTAYIVIKGNGGGNSSAKYGTPDANSTKAHQMTTNNKRTVCVGYRVYAVSKVDGTLNTSLGVVDLLDTSTYVDGYTGNNTNDFEDKSVMIGNNTVDPEEKYIKFTTDSTKDASESSGKLINVYKSLDGWNIANGSGNVFNNWMSRNNGKNMKALAMYTFNIINDDDFKTKIKDYKVVVEPLILTEIFTSSDYVTAVEKYNNYIRHYLDISVSVDKGQPYMYVWDLCCSETSERRLTKEKYAEINMNAYSYFKDRMTVYYGVAGKAMIAELTAHIKDTKAPTLETMNDLGYGGKSYSSLTVEQQVEVYAYLYKGSTNWRLKNLPKHYISVDTGILMMSTYTNIREYLATVPKLNGGVGSDNGPLSGYLNNASSGFYLNSTDLGVADGTPGIHIYDPSITMGEPIHTKDPETPDPSIPHKPEEPKPEKQNTGECTIIKVYGNVYKDGSNYYHIEDVITEVRTGTTDSIVIEQESPYNLVEWRVAKQSFTSLTATQWKSISSTNTLKQKTLPFTTYELKQSGDSGFTTTEDNPYQMEDGTVLYLLYLKTMPYIETSDTKVPDTTTDFEPTNPTSPENPSSDKNNQNNPDKKGSYNIVKIYAILDKYNGTPLKSETYTQSSTTPFIKIEQESNWTLAHWYTTNTHKPTVTGEDFFTKATDAQLKAFYENGYNLKPSSAITSVIGNTLSSGTQPTTAYFTSGNTVYLLFTRTEGQANYDATQQLITESYLAKRFSTLGYWDALGFHKSDLTLTVTTDSKI